jgi:hypothetical protein
VFARISRPLKNCPNGSLESWRNKGLSAMPLTPVIGERARASRASWKAPNRASLLPNVRVAETWSYVIHARLHYTEPK